MSMRWALPFHPVSVSTDTPTLGPLSERSCWSSAKLIVARLRSTYDVVMTTAFLACLTTVLSTSTFSCEPAGSSVLVSVSGS